MKTVRVLLVEDSEPDAALLVRELVKSGYQVTHKRIQTAGEMSQALDSEPWDIVLCDYVMPAFSGMAALELLHQRGLDLPFLIVSGQIGEDIAVQAMKAGAHDYIFKGNLKRLGPAIERELAEAQSRRKRREAESEVRRTAGELRVLANRLLEAQEEERRSIARELHDQIGQQLTILKLLLDRVKRSCGESPPAELVEAQDVLTELVSQTRNMSLGLRPGMLDDLGLLPTLEWYIADFAGKTKLSIDFEHSGLDDLLPMEIRTAAYRIIQEALTNVVRHAHADKVVVLCQADRSALSIRIEDNGVGFDPAGVSIKSSGLRGMWERAHYLGGKLDIKSAAGKGTCLVAELPLLTGDQKGEPNSG